MTAAGTPAAAPRAPAHLPAHLPAIPVAGIHLASLCLAQSTGEPAPPQTRAFLRGNAARRTPDGCPPNATT